MTRGYFLTSGIHNDIEICKTFFIEKNQMSKIQINDLDDLNVEQFATLTDLEAASIQGGITASQLSTNLGAAASGLALGGLISASFGGPIGIGIGAGLGLGAIAFGGLAGAAGGLAKYQQK